MAVQTVGGDFTVHVVSPTTRTQTVGGDFTVHVTSPTAQTITTVGGDVTIHVLSSASVTIADQTVEPFASVTLQALLAGTVSASSYTWSQSAGPAVTLTSGNGAQCSFVAPGNASQQTLTLQVVANLADGTSVSDTAVVTVLPSTEFAASGGQWVAIPTWMSWGTSPLNPAWPAFWPAAY